jgi:hypothetical protein
MNGAALRLVTEIPSPVDRPTASAAGDTHLPTAIETGSNSPKAEFELKIGRAAVAAALSLLEALQEYSAAGKLSSTRPQVGATLAELCLLRLESALGPVEFRAVVHRAGLGLLAQDPANFSRYEQVTTELFDHVIAIVSTVAASELAGGRAAAPQSTMPAWRN